MTVTRCSSQRSAKQLSHGWAPEQGHQSFEGSPMMGGRVELEGKSASIKSISDSIQSSSARSFSSFFSRISLAGSRRQLSIRKNERKGESDEPDAPLLGDLESLVGEVDVVIRRKQCDQANNGAKHGFNKCFAVEPQPPPRRRLQHLNDLLQPKQTRSNPMGPIVVQVYCHRQGLWGAPGGAVISRLRRAPATDQRQHLPFPLRNTFRTRSPRPRDIPRHLLPHSHRR